MNRVIALLLLGSTAFAQDKAPRHAKYPRWIADYSAARDVAVAEKKPMMVVLRCEP